MTPGTPPRGIDSERRQTCSNPPPTRSSWRDKPFQMVIAAFASFKITIFMGVAMVFYTVVRDPDDDNKGLFQRRRQQYLDPEPDTGQPLLEPASNSSLHLPDPSAPSSPLTRSSSLYSKYWKKVPRNVRLAVYIFLPHLLSALWVWIIIQSRVRPQQHQHLCAARQNHHGFVGNSDLYGFGVRLGLYLQWIAATFAIYCMPSARSYIASSYLLCQIGMIVAMCLLVLPGNCTFTAEVAIILHFLWAGSALVLIPHQKQGTIYSPTSPYLGIEIVSVTMASLVFLIASWFYLRLSFREAKDFLDTPGGTFLPFGLFEVEMKTTPWFAPAAMWSAWIVFATDDLISIYRDTPNIYLLSAIVAWSWNHSASMVTGQLSGFLNFIWRAICVLLTCTDVFIFMFTQSVSPASETRSENTNADDSGHFQSKYKRTLQKILNFPKRWYGLFRHLVIMAVAIWSVERMIQRNGISDVQSLNSTGQVMPLAIGIATVLSLLYIWARDFFQRDRVNTPEATPLAVVQPIGFPTASGRWI